MKIAVLGSGNGGCAVAFDTAAHGHEVRLFDFPQFPHHLKAIAAQGRAGQAVPGERGGIYAQGELSGFAPMAYVGHDLAAAIQDADLIYAVGPAYSTAPLANACRPYLKPGQTLILCPGSCGGAIEFKSALGLPLSDSSIRIAETSTLPYAVRLIEPGRIHVYLKLQGGLFLAALPASLTDSVLAMTQDVYPHMARAENVLQTGLQNGNPVIHPAVTLLNAALIQRTGGDFLFYEQGVTSAVGQLMKAVDDERIAIGQRLGLTILSDPELGVRQGYMQQADYDAGYRQAPGFLGIKAQSKLDHRYFHEDAGYGLVLWQDLARQIGVSTPTIDALIHLVGTVMGKDYRANPPRTMATLGLAGLSIQELLNRLSPLPPYLPCRPCAAETGA